MAASERQHGGARAGAGRKPAEARDELARLIDKAVPVSSRLAVLAKLSDMAQAGDIKAATLLLAYAYGRPVERQEVVGDPSAPLAVRVIYDDIKPAPATCSQVAVEAR